MPGERTSAPGCTALYRETHFWPSGAERDAWRALKHAMSHIGETINYWRKKRKISANELAGHAGVTINAIRKIESGSSAEPKFTTGMKIAAALKIEPHALMAPPPEGDPSFQELCDRLYVWRYAFRREGFVAMWVHQPRSSEPTVGFAHIVYRKKRGLPRFNFGAFRRLRALVFESAGVGSAFASYAASNRSRFGTLEARKAVRIY